MSNEYCCGVGNVMSTWTGVVLRLTAMASMTRKCIRDETYKVASMALTSPKGCRPSPTLQPDCNHACTFNRLLACARNVRILGIENCAYPPPPRLYQLHLYHISYFNLNVRTYILTATMLEL